MGFCPCFLKFLLFPVVFGGDPSQANMQHYFKSLIQILGKDMFTFYFALIAPQLSFHCHQQHPCLPQDPQQRVWSWCLSRQLQFPCTAQSTTYCIVPCTVIGILAKEVLTWVSQEYRPGQGPRMTNWDPGGDTRHLKSSLFFKAHKDFGRR